MRIGRRDLDVGVVVALTWLLVAAAATVFLAPRLGLRGWGWLLAHDLLCVAGCSHELWRGWRRRAARRAPPPGAPPTPPTPPATTDPAASR